MQPTEKHSQNHKTRTELNSYPTLTKYDTLIQVPEEKAQPDNQNLCMGHQIAN